MHGNCNQTRKHCGKLTEKKCAHKKFYVKIPEYAKLLKTFGEIGVVISISTIKEKYKAEERHACS